MSQQYPAISSARRTRTRLGAVLVAAATLTLGGLALGPASPALAHDQLVDTQVVTANDGSVEAVRLSFSNNIMEVGTEFVVTDAAGTDTTDGPPEVAGPDVTQPLMADLEAGDYAGAWRVVSSDGHPIDGTFTLKVAADGTAELSEAAPTEEHAEDHGTDHDAADTGATASNDEMPEAPTSLYIFLAVGGVLVIGVVVASFMARSRRLAQMQRDAAQGGEGQTPGDTK